MKRTYTLIVLLGIMMGSLLTGCDNGNKAPDSSMASTNAPAPAAAPMTTNK